MERYPQPRAVSDLLRRPGFDRRFRRYRHPPAALQYQPAAVLAETVSAGAAGGRALSVFAKDWIRSPDRRGGAGATDASSSLLNQQTGSWSSVVMNEMGLNELLPLFPAAGPDAGRHAERRGGGADRCPPRRRWPPGRWMSVAPRWAAARSTKGYLHDPRHHLLHRDRLPRPADGERGDALSPYRSRTGDLLFPMQAGTPNIDWLQHFAGRRSGAPEQAIAAVERAAAASSGSRTSMANVRRLQPGRAGRLFGVARTTRAELRRAVFEGGLRHCRCAAGLSAGRRAVSTAAARPRRRLQIIADCTGRTVVSSAFNELSARRGDLAARSVAALAETPPLAQTRYQPRPQAHARYAALYPLPPAARADAAGMAGQTGRPSTSFSGPTTMKIVLPPSMLATLAPSTSWASCWWRWALGNRNSAPVS